MESEDLALLEKININRDVVLDFKVNYNKATNANNAFEIVKAYITPEFLDKFSVKVVVNYDETNKCMQAKGSGFTLDLLFKETHCEAKLDLSFLLKPLKSSILEKVQDKLNRHL